MFIVNCNNAPRIQKFFSNLKPTTNWSLLLFHFLLFLWNFGIILVYFLHLNFLKQFLHNRFFCFGFFLCFFAFIFFGFQFSLFHYISFDFNFLLLFLLINLCLLWFLHGLNNHLSILLMGLFKSNSESLLFI